PRNGQALKPAVNDQAEEQPENAEQNTDHQELVAIDAEELDLRKVRKLQTGLTRRFRGRLGQGSSRARQHQGPSQGDTGRKCPQIAHSNRLQRSLSTLSFLLGDAGRRPREDLQISSTANK